jgi:hypothetical protein
LTSAPKGHALDERHGVPEETDGLAGVVERQDVRVIEAGCQMDLTEETLRAEHWRHFRTQDLQRHLPPVLQVSGEIDRGHAASPEAAQR